MVRRELWGWGAGFPAAPFNVVPCLSHIYGHLTYVACGLNGSCTDLSAPAGQDGVPLPAHLQQQQQQWGRQLGEGPLFTRRGGLAGAGPLGGALTSPTKILQVGVRERGGEGPTYPPT